MGRNRKNPLYEGRYRIRGNASEDCLGFERASGYNFFMWMIHQVKRIIRLSGYIFDLDWMVPFGWAAFGGHSRGR